MYYYWKRLALWTFPYFNHLKYLVYRLDIQKCQIRGFSNRSTQCIDLSLQQHWLPRGPRSTRRSVLALTYLSSQCWTIFPKETFFLEKLSLEEHKMEISSTKTFALWEFFVNIFIISYYNNSKVFPSAMLTATNTKLQGLSKENAQSQNFSWEWLLIDCAWCSLLNKQKNALRVTSSFINNE